MKAVDNWGEAFRENMSYVSQTIWYDKGWHICWAPSKRNVEVGETEKSDDEGEAWFVISGVIWEFLGNQKDLNYKQLIAKLTENFKELGCYKCKSLKAYFLLSHQDFFRENLGDIIEKYGKKFHQDFAIMKRRYIWSLFTIVKELLISRVTLSSKHLQCQNVIAPFVYHTNMLPQRSGE